MVLDIDETFDEVHGGQQMSLFNGYFGGYGYQPILVFDEAGRLVSSVLRPAGRPSGKRGRMSHPTIDALNPPTLAEYQDSASGRRPLQHPGGYGSV